MLNGIKIDFISHEIELFALEKMYKIDILGILLISFFFGEKKVTTSRFTRDLAREQKFNVSENK